MRKLGARAYWLNIGVRLLAMLCVGAVYAGGKSLAGSFSRKLADLILSAGTPGEKFYFGLRKSLAKFDRGVAGRNVVARKDKEFRPRGRLTSGLLCRVHVRADIASLTSLERLETAIADQRQDFSDFANPPPVFRQFDFDQNERDRFVFDARQIPFIEQPNIYAELHDFLNSDKPFAWKIIHGSGGVGKSRLALEYCLNKAGGWDCGFLRRNATQPNWDRWQPDTPHLLVIDYPSADQQVVANLVQCLAARAQIFISAGSGVVVGTQEVRAMVSGMCRWERGSDRD